MRIIVFGDSIAAGAFDLERHGWVSLLTMYQYERILRTAWEEGDSVVNASVSGDTSIDLLRRVDADTQSRRWKEEPFVSVLAIGTNDAAREYGEHQVPFADFSNNIDTLTTKLQKYGDVVVLGLLPVFEQLSSPWVFNKEANWLNNELEKYDTELQRIAKEKNLLFISLQDVIDRNSDTHLPDGLHPNAEGHRLIFERVKVELEKKNIL